MPANLHGDGRIKHQWQGREIGDKGGSLLWSRTMKFDGIPKCKDGKSGAW